MKSEEKPKKETIYRTFPISVRFSEEEYNILKSYAALKDKKVSTLVRQSCIAYLQNFAEHDNLFNKIKTEDPQEVQQTIFDVLNKHTEIIDKSLKNLETELGKKLEIIDILQRKEIFLQLLHNRELPADEYGKLEKAANRRIKVLLEDVK